MQTFLRKNKFSLVARAHQVKRPTDIIMVVRTPGIPGKPGIRMKKVEKYMEYEIF